MDTGTVDTQPGWGNLKPNRWALVVGVGAKDAKPGGPSSSLITKCRASNIVFRENVIDSDGVDAVTTGLPGHMRLTGVGIAIVLVLNIAPCLVWPDGDGMTICWAVKVAFGVERAAACTVFGSEAEAIGDVSIDGCWVLLGKTAEWTGDLMTTECTAGLVPLGLAPASGLTINAFGNSVLVNTRAGDANGCKNVLIPVFAIRFVAGRAVGDGCVVEAHADSSNVVRGAGTGRLKGDDEPGLLSGLLKSASSPISSSGGCVDMLWKASPSQGTNGIAETLNSNLPCESSSSEMSGVESIVESSKPRIVGPCKVAGTKPFPHCCFTLPFPLPFEATNASI